MANAQVSTLSISVLLPRLLPAPQALLRTSRPDTLEPHAGKVIGAYSGNRRDSVNHIAHLLHCRDPLPDYTVRCHQITKLGNKTAVSAKITGPLVWLNVLGLAMSIALLILAIIRGDGFALLATLLLSILSTMIGLGCRWDLKLMPRSADRPVPSDNIVIVYPQGAFVVVKCGEDVARELYWHPEKCVYRLGDTTYHLISLAGTLILMFGVICLGNSTLPLQAAYGAAYIILNAAYWSVAALPPRSHWDLSCYKVESESYEDEDKVGTYTLALWRAMAITQSTEWVKKGQIAPDNEAWNTWIDCASDQLKQWRNNRGETTQTGKQGTDGQSVDPKPLSDWDAQGTLTEIFQQYARRDEQHWQG